MEHSRVLIADDHTLVAELCKQLLEPEFKVVGIVGDGRALVQAASQLMPDVIIVDVSMPVLNGLDATEILKKDVPKVKIIFLTVTDDVDVAVEAFSRGASGYLLKTCAASELLTAVRTVLRGEKVLSPTISRHTVDFLLRRRNTLVDEKERLTARQREVLQLLAEGKVMKQVAWTLNMSTRTVAFHKYRIMDVLGAESDADLIKYAIRNHMVDA
ncbi:MAG TPA: response regulator transcription factor [Terriglobales bacterium]